MIGMKMITEIQRTTKNAQSIDGAIVESCAGIQTPPVATSVDRLVGSAAKSQFTFPVLSESLASARGSRRPRPTPARPAEDLFPPVQPQHDGEHDRDRARNQ